MQTYQSVLRFRVEEPLIQIYAESENDLLTALSHVDFNFRDRITSVSAPESKESAELLKQGVIITKKPSEYTHKVFLRDGRYDRDLLNRTLEYLDSIPEQVKVSKATREQINRSHGYIWNCWFYTNDFGYFNSNGELFLKH